MTDITEAEREIREALAANPDPISTDLYGDRYFGGDYSRVDLSKAQDALIAACHQTNLAVILAELERLRAEREELAKLYNELLLQVGKKYPGESRHETALRYLRRAEEPQNNPAVDAARKGE